MDPSSAQATLAHYWDDVADTSTSDHINTTMYVQTKPGTSMLYTFLYGVATTIAVLWLGHWINAWRRARRKRASDLQCRRRHGIPDSDTRPFHVAYRDSSIAARDSMRKSQSMLPEVNQNPQMHATTGLSTANIREGFRPRGRARPSILSFPRQPPSRVLSGSFNSGQARPAYPAISAPDSPRTLSQLSNSTVSGSWGPRYSTGNFRATSSTIPTVSSRTAFAIVAASSSLRSSNAFTSDVGGAGRHTWQSANHLATGSRGATGNLSRSRPQKRLYLTVDEEDEELESDAPTDKRSRTAAWGSEAMIHGENQSTCAQSDLIEPKPIDDSQPPQIGKCKGKRPADDDEGDLRADGKRRHKPSKQSPKPSVAQEKRGTKRERKEVDTTSVPNDVMPVHKRGRAGDHNNDMSVIKEEDIDDEYDLNVSRDPLCGGRRSGQKWTSNGQEYMVGSNGNRLRLATVKESRKKYYMPTDSKHADRFDMIEVLVEKWLTEEQYAKAKADRLLAWQKNETLSTVVKQESPEKVLEESKEIQTRNERPRALSTSAITLSRARIPSTIWNTPGQSPLHTNDPHINPFRTPPATTPQSPGPQRVRFTVSNVPVSVLNANRVSTWEKQEREENALKALRERRAAEAAAKSTPIPSIIITPPAPITTTPAPAPKPAESTPAPTLSLVPAQNPFSLAAPKKDEAAKPLLSATPTATPSPFSAPATASPFGAAPATAKPSPFAFSAPSTAPQPTTNPMVSTGTSSFGATTAVSTTAFSSTSAMPAAPSLFGAPPTAPSPAATKPMGGFSFNLTPAANSAVAAAGSSLFGGQPVAKPASTGFSFNATNSNTNGTLDKKSTGSSFSFATQPTTTPASTGTGFGNAHASKPNPFASTATSSGFGTGFGAGASSSPFTFNSPKTITPAAAPVFGTQPAASSSDTTFKFGETSSTTATGATSGGSTFQFGATKPVVSIPTSNGFGPPSTVTPTSSTGTLTFGANVPAASPATPSQPLLNLNVPPASPVIGTRQISGSKRVQRAMSKAPQ